MLVTEGLRLKISEGGGTAPEREEPIERTESAGDELSEATPS